MHGCHSGPFEAQLPGRLAHTVPLQGVNELSQRYRPPPHSCYWPQNKPQKSVLTPSRQTVFLGVHLDSVQMQARLARFKLGHHITVSTFRRLLGLMAARLIRVSRSFFHTLLIWRDTTFLQSGVRMGAVHHRHMVVTDASLTGWGAVFEGRPAHSVWTGEFLSWHTNCLELRAVFLALIHFLPLLRMCHVIVRTDNMVVVSDINRHGGSRSRSLNRLVCCLLLWSQNKFLSLRAVHVPGVLNLTDDFMSRQ